MHKVSPNTRPPVRVNTDLGELTIVPYAGFEDMVHLIQDYGVSLNRRSIEPPVPTY
jgi:hypothetical protein